MKHYFLIEINGIICTQILGTPTEENWPGVSRLPGYRTARSAMHRSHRLGTAFPRLHDSREAEALAASLLQPDPSRRISAQDALHHNYFASLPRRLYDLPDGT